MLELMMQGAEPSQSRRQLLRPGENHVIGRASDASLSVPWDSLLSRRHVQLDVQPGHVQLKRVKSARNPLFFAGESVESCRVEIGQHFVVGATSFYLVEAEADGSLPAAPVEEFAFKPQELRKIRYQDPENRIEVLTHLPEVIDRKSVV